MERILAKPVMGGSYSPLNLKTRLMTAAGRRQREGRGRAHGGQGGGVDVGQPA